jgi:cytidine deaminase
MTTSKDMLDLATQMMANAYAPYSNYPVGAALRGESGRVYGGCNVENAAYSQGVCAEASAISALIAGGDRRIIEILVLARGDGLATPCGGCRQKLREFADEAVSVHIAGPEGVRRSLTLGELLPLSFGPDNLKL